MLHLVKDIKGLSLCAAGHDVGNVRDILFDDLTFTVRYFVVKTGGWLSGRDVLISPTAITGVHPEKAILETYLTQQQIEKSPPLVLNPPVSRQYEELLHDYYSWSPYWGAGMVPSFGAFEVPPASPRTEWQSLSEEKRSQLEKLNTGDSHLQSVNEVEDYMLHAPDGDVGHVKDFLVDINDWQVKYLVVETGHWFSSRRVVVARRWIQDINWAGQDIGVILARADIENTPPYDPQAFGATYVSDLTIYYKNLFERWIDKLSNSAKMTSESKTAFKAEYPQLKLLEKAKNLGKNGARNSQKNKNNQRKISQIINSEVARLTPYDSLLEASVKMRNFDIGFMPICDGNEVLGVVTDRDIVIRGIARGLDPLNTHVKEIMTQDVVYVFDDQDVLEAARLMEVKQLRRLAVLNRDKHLVGVLSLGDVSTRSQDQLLASEVLKCVSEPTHQFASM